MAKKKLTQEQESELAMLKSTFNMLLKSKKEAEKKGQKKSAQLIDNAYQDTLEQIRRIDSTVAKKLVESINKDDVALLEFEEKEDIYSYHVDNDMPSPTINSSVVMDDNIIIDSNVQYDIVPLPSNGQCYANKQERIAVSYLTAYDENLITSPNLYNDGLVIDFLLKHKVLDKNINIDELCCGDVDAITLFLRATSYGPEFPIVVQDPMTGEKIDSIVDLSELKMKEFNLVGDENGWFDFILPVSGDQIKFRYLTRKDERLLKKMAQNEDEKVKMLTIKNNISSLLNIIQNERTIKSQDKQEYIKQLNAIETVFDKNMTNNKIQFSKTITNRLELSIMSINGNEDRQYISQYIHNMGAKDSLMLRRYILENEPGVNFEITVQRPESLGGGSFKTFLEWDDSIFLNIA